MTSAIATLRFIGDGKVVKNGKSPNSSGIATAISKLGGKME